MAERNDYPRPQLRRDNWQCLNGCWDFFYTDDRGKNTKCKINVPFCPESVLSGVKNTDFMSNVKYKKVFTFSRKNKTVLLNFGAVDYKCKVFLNGCFVGAHTGGYTPFALDVSTVIHDGQNMIELAVTDDHRCSNQPRGKQSSRLLSSRCHYTRTTGIWQTVWIEQVDSFYIKSLKIDTDYKTGSVFIKADLSRPINAIAFTGVVVQNGRPCGYFESDNDELSFKIDNFKLWSVESPVLYDIQLCLYHDGKLCDSVSSYFGIRSAEMRKNGFFLNGKPLFLRTVLDQGFYPDGIYTAPFEAALEEDILLSKKLGFNGARLHQKVFEERYLYNADRLGYLVFGEYASWGFDHTDESNTHAFLAEWTEVIKRDYSHPCIIGWCPLNETGDRDGVSQSDSLIRKIYLTTKKTDKTRPCIDTSGFLHVETDIFDIHEYEQDPNLFIEKIDAAIGEHSSVYISEYGGAAWSSDTLSTWGYGERIQSENEFVQRYSSLTQALLSEHRICGFCYTQLTDVEQECNGLYHYDRTPKFSAETYEKILAVNSAKSAFETENGL